MLLVIKTASDLQVPCDIAGSVFADTAQTEKRKGKKWLAQYAALFNF